MRLDAGIERDAYLLIVLMSAGALMPSSFKIISGGQTGVDRAALDVGLELGIEVGGWCPKGRVAEDGQIPDYYPLVETRSAEIHVRTQRNVESSSATLIITRGAPIGGTRFTVETAQSMRRPLLIVDLNDQHLDPVIAIIDWLQEVSPHVLNIAGPRESGAPGITHEARAILDEVLQSFGYSRST